MEGIVDDKLLDLFSGTLKDNIQLEVDVFEPTSIEKDFMVASKVESKKLAMETRRTTPNTSRESHAPVSNPLVVPMTMSPLILPSNRKILRGSILEILNPTTYGGFRHVHMTNCS